MYQYSSIGNRISQNSYTTFLFFDAVPSQYERYFLPMLKDVDASIVTGIEFRTDYTGLFFSPDLDAIIQYNGKNYTLADFQTLQKVVLTTVSKSRNQSLSNFPASSLVKNRQLVPSYQSNERVILSKKLFLEILTGESFIMFTDIAALTAPFCIGITFHFDDKN